MLPILSSKWVLFDDGQQNIFDWPVVSQDPREKRVTVDEVPSGVYLYPEEEVGVDSIFSPCPSRPSGTLFEEAQKEILKLMKIEVRHFLYFYI